MSSWLWLRRCQAHPEKHHRPSGHVDDTIHGLMAGLLPPWASLGLGTASSWLSSPPASPGLPTNTQDSRLLPECATPLSSQPCAGFTPWHHCPLRPVYPPVPPCPSSHLQGPLYSGPSHLPTTTPSHKHPASCRATSAQDRPGWEGGRGYTRPFPGAEVCRAVVETLGEKVHGEQAAVPCPGLAGPRPLREAKARDKTAKRSATWFSARTHSFLLRPEPTAQNRFTV